MKYTLNGKPFYLTPAMKKGQQKIPSEVTEHFSVPSHKHPMFSIEQRAKLL